LLALGDFENLDGKTAFLQPRRQGGAVMTVDRGAGDDHRVFSAMEAFKPHAEPAEDMAADDDFIRMFL
jgi:hypothetical protein